MSVEPSPLDAALDSIINAPIVRGGGTCQVSRVMQTLPSETAERIRRLIDESDVQATIIAATLRDAGLDVSYSSIIRHRRRVKGVGTCCRCPQ